MHERSALKLSADAVGRAVEWQTLVDFASNDANHATLGLVWGRRRIGKSFLLSQLCGADGIYYEAVRGSEGETLTELGALLASAVGAPAPLDLPTWDRALAALMELSGAKPITVVLDEYPYLREQSPELDSIIQRAFGPNSSLRAETRCRLILCGSAVSVMSELLTGTAALRGRAGLDLRVSPFDFRGARELYGTEDLELATQLYATIGGVAAYARDMVDDDLPASLDELSAWTARRVMSPSAPLSREVELLLAEDPTTAQARRLNLYHSALAAIASGRRTPGRIADYVKISGPRLDPILRALLAAEFVERLSDPTRENRPTYHPADSIIRFHYAVMRPRQSKLSRYGTDLQALWDGAQDTFRSNVVGPTFEMMSRHWVAHYASEATIGTDALHVGSTAVLIEGTEREIDIVVARDDGDHPSQRSIAAIGEAKSGERITFAHLNHLEAVRAAFGSRAKDAKLLLVGTRFAENLSQAATRRRDVELVDLERLYFGS